MKAFISIGIISVFFTIPVSSQNLSPSQLKGSWYISDTLFEKNINKLHFVRTVNPGNNQKWEFFNDSILSISHIFTTSDTFEKTLDNKQITKSTENYLWKFNQDFNNKNYLTINAWASKYTYNFEKISETEFLLSAVQNKVFPFEDNHIKQFYFTYPFKDSTFLSQKQLTLTKIKSDIKLPYLIFHPDSSFNISYNIKYAEQQGSRGWIAYKRGKQINGKWKIDNLRNELTLVLKNNDTIKYNILQNNQYLCLKRQID